MVADLRGLSVSRLHHQPNLRTYGHGCIEQAGQGPNDDSVVVFRADYCRQHARWSGAADPDEPVSFAADPHQPNHLAHLRYWRSSWVVDYPRTAPPRDSF